MRREPSSTSGNFLFSLLIFLFISEIQARKLQQECSSSCGNINNIGSPFRLRNDPVECGDPDYELSCESNKTILELNSRKFYVKGILPEEKIINVIDFNLANGSCSLPKISLSERDLFNDLNPLIIGDLSDRFRSGFNNRFISDERHKYINACFLRCSRNIRDPAYQKLPCLSGNQSHFYVNYGCNTIADIPDLCSFISVTPVTPTLYQDVTYPSYETIQKLLASGFRLRWSVECRKCALAGGSCFFNGGLVDCFHLNGTSNLSSFRQWMYLPISIIKLVFWSPFTDPLHSTLLYPELYIYDGITYEQFNFELGTISLLGHIVLVLVIVRFIFASITLFLYIIHKYKTTWKTVDQVEKFLHSQQSWMPKRYSYTEIMAMTNHFKDKLGKGGFGSVYKGQLHNGYLIAVKELENAKFSAEEFINEVSTIGRIHHINVVQLVGFCAEGSKRSLVYEYMPNGSLDRHIFSKTGKGQSFSWQKLYEIALGIARGIEYLHGGCDVCILHFDIKPHNILLDHNFIPKVSDFGLAKFYPKENDFVSISATRGTIGYIAPELISRNFGLVSCKSDVYSFGMLLLEMAGGRRNSFSLETHSSRAYFPSWAFERIKEGGDLELQGVTENEIVIARKLCIIGLSCIQVKPADRPSITEVIEMLEGSIDDLQMPPKPFFSSSEHISAGDIRLASDSTELAASQSLEESSCSNSDI